MAKFSLEFSYTEVNISVNQVPGPPVNVRLSTKRTRNMIKIRWDPPEEHPQSVHHYELQMKHKKKDDWKSVRDSYKLSAKATGLKSNTTYYFRVYSKDGRGRGNFSEQIEGKTRLGKAAVAALTPLVFAGGTIAAPFVGAVGGGVAGGVVGGATGVVVAEGIDNKAGAAAAGIGTGVPLGVAGGVVGTVGGGVLGTVGAPVVGGLLAKKFVDHGDSYSSQSSEDDDDN